MHMMAFSYEHPEPVARLSFDKNDVQAALKNLQKDVPLGDSPLRNLVAVWERTVAGGPTGVVDTDPVRTAVRDVLHGLVVENLSRLRELEGRTEPENTRDAHLAALADDFKHRNDDLQAWSVVYYRDVRTDLGFKPLDLSTAIPIAKRHVRRWRVQGAVLLTRALGELESEARARNLTVWRRLKLPPMSHANLYGLERPAGTLRDALTTPDLPPLTVVSGAGGLGKTTLAHVVLSELAASDHFGDVAWIGLSEPTSYAALLPRVARALGYAHLSEEGHEELERTLRANLSMTPSMVVLDNADQLAGQPQSMAQLAALVGPGKLLAIMRGAPGGETQSRVVGLDPLSRDAAAQLIADVAAQREIAQASLLSEEALDRIYGAVGGNPLALQLVAGQLASLPLERVLDDLSNLRTGRGQPLFEALFAATWASLGEAARRAALSLLLIPPEGAFWEDLSLVNGLRDGALNAAVTELVAVAFLEALGPGPRYAIHALTRQYLEQVAAGEDYAPLFREIVREALRTADSSVDDDVEAPGGPQVASWLQLLRWQAATGLEPDLLGRLVTRLAPGARRSGQWERWLAVLGEVRDVLEGDERWAELADARLETGVALRWLGQVESASEALEGAIMAYGGQGNFPGQAEALVELAALYAASGQTGEAIVAYRRAVDTAKRYEARDTQRRALNGLAMLLLQAGAVEEAIGLLLEARNLSQEQVDAQTLSNLGEVYLRAGRAAEAVSLQAEALAEYQTAGDLPNEARAHVRLASAYVEAEDFDLARHHFQEGLGMMRTLGDAFGQARALVRLGAAHNLKGDFEEAIVVYNDALALMKHQGDEASMAVTLYNLAAAQWAAGNERVARASLREAAELAEATQQPGLLRVIDDHPARKTQ